jgi:hypothetical protein
VATAEFGTKPKWLNVRLAPLLGDKRTSNALFAGTRAVPVRKMFGTLSPPSLPGLTRQSIFFAKRSCEADGPAGQALRDSHIS